MIMIMIMIIIIIKKMSAIRRWFIYNIWVRYHTHTPKHKTHTRACALNTKTKKLKKVKDVKVEKQRKAEELWC